MVRHMEQFFSPQCGQYNDGLKNVPWLYKIILQLLHIRQSFHIYIDRALKMTPVNNKLVMLNSVNIKYMSSMIGTIIALILILIFLFLKLIFGTSEFPIITLTKKQQPLCSTEHLILPFIYLCFYIF